MDLDKDTDILNIKYLGMMILINVISNTLATFEAQFMKKLSNTEAEWKKTVDGNRFFLKILEDILAFNLKFANKREYSN